MSDAPNAGAAGAPLDFRVPAGNIVPTQVLELSATHAGVLATIEVGPAEWTLIDLVMLFNLLWDRRTPGEIEGDGTVQIVMQLDPALADRVDRHAPLDSLTAAPIEDDLRSTTSWFGLEVTEAVAMPPDLAAKGEVRQGFTTTWPEELQRH